MTEIAVWNRTNGEELVKATTSLTLTQCWCGCPVAVPSDLYKFARRHPEQAIYCPLGHTFVWKKSEADRLREQLDNERDRRARYQAELDQAKAHLRGARIAKTRFKNERDRLRTRAAAGVCPCCQRTFQQLARHMQAKHPDYPPEPTLEDTTAEVVA
jgi:hypothetical protein